ncbi:hypothetical protein [Nostoc sp. UIC 10607]
MPWDFRRGKKNTQPTTKRSPQVQQCDPVLPRYLHSTQFGRLELP